MNLLLLQLRNKMFSRKTVCQGLYIDKTCFPDVFFDSPLNTDTRIIRTLWHVPLVSVLTGFHCTVTSLRSLLTNKNFQHSQKARKMIFMGLLGRCSLSPRVSLSHACSFLHLSPPSTCCAGYDVKNTFNCLIIGKFRR